MYSVFLLILVVLASSCTIMAWRRHELRRVVFLAAVTGGLVAWWCSVTGAYEVRKLVAQCLMPVGLMWLVLFGLAVQATRMRLRRWFVTVCWVLWIGLTVLGNGFFSTFGRAALERSYSDGFDVMKAGPFDAVLVLGGGIALAENGQSVLGSAGDRVALAARLYHRGRVAVLVTSGPFLQSSENSDASVPKMTFEVWKDFAVSPEDVVLVEGPRSTVEEISRFAALVESRGWRRVGLITSAYHLNRALRLCRRHGLEVTPLPADIRGMKVGLRPRDLVPSSVGLVNSRLVWWEFLGTIAGR